MKKYISLLLLSLAVIVLSGCSQKETVPVPPAPEQAPPAPVQQETDTPYETDASWLEYRSSTYGFSINYPSDWPIMDIDPEKCGDGNVCTILFGSDRPLEEDDTEKNIIELLIHSPKSLELNNGQDGSMDCENIETVNIGNGLPAEMKQCKSPLDGSSQDYITFENAGWKYQLVKNSKQDTPDIFFEMANSFTFLKRK